jgi:hypothetical protein
LAIGATNTVASPGWVFAAPSGTAAPSAAVSEMREKRGSTPSLNFRRISLADATVAPTPGVAFSSWACAKAAVAAKA